MIPLFADNNLPRILLVKTSSLGDILHNLPVVSDIAHHYPNAQVDWVVEDNFSALPLLHPSVCNIIPVAVRRWRRKLFSTATWHEISTFCRDIASRQYDVAIDTQGLLKSAMLMRGAQGIRCGFDSHSAREPLAAFLYQRTFQIAYRQHAIERNRQLAAQALGYILDAPALFGIVSPKIDHPTWLPDCAYVVLLHATSRADKFWLEASWIELGCYLHDLNIRCILPWGSEAERIRSSRLAKVIPGAILPPLLSLNEVALLLGSARAVVGVDTGLAHLAAALGVPTIGIYTATDPALTGLYAARNTINLGGINQSPDVTSVINEMRRIASC